MSAIQSPVVRGGVGGVARVGLDVGGTKTHGVLIGADGAIRAEVRRASGHGPEQVVRAIRDVIAELTGAVPETVASIGIGVPGHVLNATTVRHAVNLGIDELDLVAALAPQTACSIRVENDVKAASLGAFALRGRAEDMAYLNIGTGVAAGLVLDGILHRGATGVAGEVGHVSIDPAGPPCVCGQRGCIEALCGGGAVASRWDRETALPIADVFANASTDERAANLVTDIARGIAGAVRVVALTVDVDVIVLGGGVIAVGEPLVDAVRAALVQDAAQSAFLASLRLSERIEVLPSSSPAAAVGAALVGCPDHAEGALFHG